jgi:hypothetical protein
MMVIINAMIVAGNMDLRGLGLRIGKSIFEANPTCNQTPYQF